MSTSSHCSSCARFGPSIFEINDEPIFPNQLHYSTPKPDDGKTLYPSRPWDSGDSTRGRVAFKSFAELGWSARKCDFCKFLLALIYPAVALVEQSILIHPWGRLESAEKVLKTRTVYIQCSTDTVDKAYAVAYQLAIPNLRRLCIPAHYLSPPIGSGGMVLYKSDWFIFNRLGSRQSDVTKQLDEKHRLQVFKELLQTCDADHEDCKATQRIIPTRLLDVHIDQVGEVHLITTLAITNNSDIRYIALSHCWGPLGVALRTTRKNLSSHMEGIPESKLPKTFGDAVAVARGLSVRYLWIDSLCIVQDDREDWSRESATMAATYQNAYLTIAATVAKDGNGGLFQPVSQQTYATFYAPEKSHKDLHQSKRIRLSPSNSVIDVSVKVLPNLQRLIHEAPLNKRAWVLQEKILSRRIIHFTADQPIWECRQEIRSEDPVISWPRSPNSHHAFHVPTDLHSSWWESVAYFTRRDITNRQDRPAAFAGITEYYRERMRDVPVVGLWKSSLLKDLLWKPAGRPRGERQPALPTWSWLSYDGPCNILRLSDDDYFNEGNCFNETAIANVVEVQVTWSGPSMTSSLHSAKVILEGPVFEATVGGNPRHKYKEDESVHVRTLETTGPGCRKLGICRFDSIPTMQGKVVYCLAITRWTNGRSLIYQFFVIVLKKIEMQNGYCRLGIGVVLEQFPGTSSRSSSSVEGAETRTIDLI